MNAPHSPRPPPSGDLWAITSYFNPAGFRRRLANYRVFRRHLQVPLLAIELSFGDDFELGKGDAERLLQIRGGDVLWQKERLLNLALDALPEHCRKVVWLDCDLVFTAGDWAEQTARLLDSHPLVQPFARARAMPAGWQPGDDPDPRGIEPWHSMPALIASGASVADATEARVHLAKCCHGYAWAAHRSFLADHRFYDACVVGGGDSALMRAAYGHAGATPRLQFMSPRQSLHYLEWAERIFAAVNGDVRSAAGEILHLWHGEFWARGYRARNEGFRCFDFDPEADIAIGPNGAWRWSSDKAPMHTYLRDYFASRKEDD